MTESTVDQELSALTASGGVPGIVAGATDRRRMCDRFERALYRQPKLRC